MKKVTSISLLLLMIAAMLHISVATHFCGGTEVASKISLSGKLANCGMESSQNELPLPGLNLTKHCCDDVVTHYATDSNYVPSSYFAPETYQYNFQTFQFTATMSFNNVAGFTTFYSYLSPPGTLMSTEVDLSAICVFRI